jgi:hypothetical protein
MYKSEQSSKMLTITLCRDRRRASGWKSDVRIPYGRGTLLSDALPSALARQDLSNSYCRTVLKIVVKVHEWSVAVADCVARVRNR